MTTTYPNDGPPLALMPEQCFTIRETADILKVSEITVRRLVARGQLRASGSGRLLRFTLQAIRDYQSGVYR
jgi:excisionase family DNA binding protein